MLLLAPLLACLAPPAGGDSGVTAGPVALVAPDGWSLATAAEDPYAAERPAELDCPSWAFHEEDGTFEVETDLCSLGTFVQPTAAPVAAGQALRVALYHLDLWAAEPAEAHLAVGVAEQVLFEVRVPIPGEPAAYEVRVPATAALPQGSPAWFHVHNHGVNSYRLSAIEAL